LSNTRPVGDGGDMEQTPKYLARYMTPELVRQLEEKIGLIMDGSGYGEITITIEACKLKWMCVRESEPVRTPFE